MAFTLQQMAERIAEAEGRPDQAALWQKVRGLHQRGLLTPTDNAGPKGAFRFDFYELCLARILISALELQIESSELGHLVSVLRTGRNDSFGEISLKRVLDETQPATVRRRSGHLGEMRSGQIEYDGPLWVIEISRSKDPATWAPQTSFTLLQSVNGLLQRPSIYPDPMRLDVLAGGIAIIESVAYLKVTAVLLPLIATQD